jgi:hypothetical protein
MQPAVPKGLKPMFIPNPALYKLHGSDADPNALLQTKQNRREEIPSL